MFRDTCQHAHFSRTQVVLVFTIDRLETERNNTPTEMLSLLADAGGPFAGVRLGKRAL